MENIVLSIKKQYSPDVMVCGLGPAGISAAVAAARSGAKVLAVDKCAYSGGNITAANVIGMCGCVNMHTGKLITGGITAELMQASGYQRDAVDFDLLHPLSKMDIYNEILQPAVPAEKRLYAANAVALVYDAEEYKLAADRILKNAGVEVLYHTFVADVEMKGETIEKVIITNKDGVCVVTPKIVVDCTGDGDIAAWSGAPYEILTDTMQAGTMMFVMGGVEYDNYVDMKISAVKAFKKAEEDGVKCRYMGPGVGRLHHGVINFNMTRVPYNQCVAKEWTEAEMGARNDIEDCVKILKAYAPEFKNAYLLYSGPHIGARETRRIKAEYVLKLEDIAARKSFKDTICLGGNPIDFHNPKIYGQESLKHEIKEDDILKPYEIPYRTLLPQKVNNLVVAGRCHGADQMTASSTRVALTCSAMGEAAGYATYLALASRCTPSEINTDILRGMILKNKGILSEE